MQPKIKLLKVLDILRATDETHPITAVGICKLLEAEGISAERKSVYSDIEALCEYGCDIIRSFTPKRGFFLASREFEEAEIYLLCDAVRSAKFISTKKTRELLHKLNSMMSVNNLPAVSDTVYFNLDDKSGNEEIYYHIDRINRAIKAKRQIKLKYASRFFGAA